jgi:hypothetical protein
LLLLVFAWLTSTLKMEAICSFETSDYLRTTLCYNPEDCTLHSHLRDNLRSSKNCFSALATAAARLQSQVTLSGIYAGQNDTGAGFLLVLRLRIPKDVGSHLGPVTGCPDFRVFVALLTPSLQKLGYYLKLGRDLFLSHSFQFIVHFSSYRSMRQPR